MIDTRAFDDLHLLLPLERLVQGFDPAGPPEARIIATPARGGQPLDVGRIERVGVLPGSFNPLHDAHVALARHGGDAAHLDAVFYCLSKRTVDKEQVSGLGLTDRLHVLRLHCSTEERRGALFVNRGLYVDQARIVYAAFPSLRDLWFLVGYDKMVQIFDPRYYADRDAALSELFGMARFLVAPRGDSGHDELRRLLAQPENQRFVSFVEPIDLPVALRDVSSSDVREAVTHGSLDVLLVPDVVRDFIRHTGAYAEPLRLPHREIVERAAVRRHLLEALAADRPWLPQQRDLNALVRLTVADSPEGHELRRRLRDEEVDH